MFGPAWQVSGQGNIRGIAIDLDVFSRCYSIPREKSHRVRTQSRFVMRWRKESLTFLCPLDLDPCCQWTQCRWFSENNEQSSLRLLAGKLRWRSTCTNLNPSRSNMLHWYVTINRTRCYPTAFNTRVSGWVKLSVKKWFERCSSSPMNWMHWIYVKKSTHYSFRSLFAVKVTFIRLELSDWSIVLDSRFDTRWSRNRSTHSRLLFLHPLHSNVNDTNACRSPPTLLQSPPGLFDAHLIVRVSVISVSSSQRWLIAYHSWMNYKQRRSIHLFLKGRKTTRSLQTDGLVSLWKEISLHAISSGSNGVLHVGIPRSSHWVLFISMVELNWCSLFLFTSVFRIPSESSVLSLNVVNWLFSFLFAFLRLFDGCACRNIVENEETLNWSIETCERIPNGLYQCSLLRELHADRTPSSSVGDLIHGHGRIDESYCDIIARCDRAMALVIEKKSRTIIFF